MDPEKFCFVCREPATLSNALNLSENTEPAFDFLCKLFELSCLSKLDFELGCVENSEFCESCAVKIVTTLSVFTELKILESQLADLKSDLRQTISSTYDPIKLKLDDRGGLRIGKLLSQYWGGCHVAVPRIPDEIISEMCTRRRATLRQRKEGLKPKKDTVTPADVNDDISMEKSLEPFDDFDGDQHIPRDDIDDLGHGESESVKTIGKDDDDKGDDEWQKMIEEGEGSKPAKKAPRKRRRRSKYDKTWIRRKNICKLCEKEFKTRIMLKKHLEKKHQVDIMHLCWHCGHNFNSNRVDGLGVYNFKCDMKDCDRAYATLPEIRVHHTAKCPKNPAVPEKSERRHQCEQCGKAYFGLQTLRDHIASVHEKKFKLFCDQCGAGFQNNGSLKKHIFESHSSERPFTCEFCAKGYKKMSTLECHRRVHTGERPFVCDQCGKSYMAGDKLKRHKLCAHQDPTIPCPHCGTLFSSDHYLRNHVEAVHNKNPKYISARKPKKSEESNEIPSMNQTLQSRDHFMTQNFLPPLQPAHLGFPLPFLENFR